MFKITDTPLNLQTVSTSTETVYEQKQNTVFDGKNGNNEYQEFLTKYNITLEQLKKILVEHPDFIVLDQSSQTQIVNQIKSNQQIIVEEVSSENSNSISSIEDIIKYDDSNCYNSSNLEDPLVKYFYNSNLTVEQKKEVLLVELIKAEFISKGGTLEEFQALVTNEEEFSKLKAEANTFIEEQIKKTQNKCDKIPEGHILDELFAKVLVSRQDITTDEKFSEISPREYINAISDKNNPAHKIALNNYQDFLDNNWNSGSKSHMAELLRVYNAKLDIMNQFRNILQEEPELIKKLEENGITLESFGYISELEDFADKYSEFLKNNPDLVEKSPFLQKNNTLEKISLNILQEKIDMGSTLTPAEEKEYHILQKFVKAEEERNIQGAKNVNKELTTLEDFTTGELKDQFSICESDEEKANFMWQTIYSKYADENGNIPEEKRALFLKDIENLIASAQHAGLYSLANDFLVPMKAKFTTQEEKQEELRDPWSSIDAEVGVGTGSFGTTKTLEYLQVAGNDNSQLVYFLEACRGRSDGEAILNDVATWASDNENLSSEVKQIYSNYSSNYSNSSTQSSSSQNTETIINNNTTTSYTSNQTQTNPITNNNSNSTPVQGVHSAEEAVNQLDLQEETDKQRLVDIVSQDSTVLGKLDPQKKQAVLEAYCKQADGARLFELFKKNPSLYSELLNLAFAKINIYKDEMFKVLISKSDSDMEKFAKELGIDLVKFSKQNKEYAAKVAIATKNADFANAIIRNTAFYGLQMGSSEYFDLIQLTQKKNEELKQNEAPVYSQNRTAEVTSKILFKA